MVPLKQKIINILHRTQCTTFDNFKNHKRNDPSKQMFHAPIQTDVQYMVLCDL